MIIAIDFDGTCVTHEFPNIGKDIGAIPVLKALVNKGHRLILWTMRSDIESPSATEDAGAAGELHLIGGKYLTHALAWFKHNEIPLWGVQVNPEQQTWSKSPKAYAHMYIDDAALGCPLIYQDTGNKEDRPYVDWVAIEKMLKQMKIL
jgi:hypothetical protein